MTTQLKAWNILLKNDCQRLNGLIKELKVGEVYIRRANVPCGQMNGRWASEEYDKVVIMKIHSDATILLPWLEICNFHGRCDIIGFTMFHEIFTKAK